MNHPNNRKTYKGRKDNSKHNQPDQPLPFNQTEYNVVVCAKCGALKDNDTWSWDHLPQKITEALCPACERIQNQQPAGIVTLTGNIIHTNRDEIIAMITNIAASELTRYPLERLIKIEDEQDSLIVTTTGVALARHIGYALNIAFEGTLKSSFNGAEYIEIHFDKND